MKKFIAILAILMLVPFTAFGLESLSEDVMDNVTGQAGVSIATDINIDMTMDTLAWGDADGVDSDASSANDGQGWIGLKNFNMDNLRIRLNPTLAPQGIPGIAQIKLFTVDVATGTRPTGETYTFVRLGLGSQRITMDSMTAEVELGATNALGSEMGDFAILGMTMDINGTSTVDISAHEGAGVTIDLNVAIDQIHINAMSWGDADGLGTGVIAYNSNVGGSSTGDGVLQGVGSTSRGYVGIRDFQLNNMTVTGQVLIDVATLNSGLTSSSGLLYVYQSMLATGYDGGTTAVLIRLNDLHIGIGSIAGTMTMAATTALNPATAGQDLGQFYMSNVQVNVNGWVGIFAH